MPELTFHPVEDVVIMPLERGWREFAPRQRANPQVLVDYAENLLAQSYNRPVA